MAGYIGIMYEFVAVANRPTSSLTLAAALAAAVLAALLLPLELDFLLRLPNTPPTTAPTMTRMRTGTPNFIQLLMRFFLGYGATKPLVESLTAPYGDPSFPPMEL